MAQPACDRQYILDEVCVSDVHHRVPKRGDAVAPLDIASPIGVLIVVPATVHLDN